MKSYGWREQLADLLQYFKKMGHPKFKSVTIDYSFMETSQEIPPHKDPKNKPEKNQDPMYYGIDGQPQWNPEHCEVGLSNTIAFPSQGKFRGEEITKPIG